MGISFSKCFKHKGKPEKSINPEEKTVQPLKKLNTSIKEQIFYKINSVKPKQNKEIENELKNNQEEEKKFEKENVKIS
jgi:hypothetical protein